MAPLSTYLTPDELTRFFDPIGSSRDWALFGPRGEPLDAPIPRYI